MGSLTLTGSEISDNVAGRSGYDGTAYSAGQGGNGGGVYSFGGTSPSWDWKLIRYEAPKQGINETQLFNLADNPDELLPQHHEANVTALTGTHPTPNQTNLAGDPAHAAKLKEMEALLQAEMKRLDDPYTLWDQE